MMFNRKNANGFIWFAVAAFAIFLVYRCMTSGYTGFPVNISSKGSCENMNSLSYELDCAPGMSRGDAYTKSLTPGGYCDFQKAVSDCASYKLLDDGKGVALGD
jgi:hypothetical protein